MKQQQMFIEITIRTEITFLTDSKEEAQELFDIMPDSEVLDAIAKSDYFDIKDYKVLDIFEGNV